MDKKSLLLEKLHQRTIASLASGGGGDGFVFASMLSLDVGLNTRTVRGILDAAVVSGVLERKERGTGRAHKYRTIQ